MTIFDDGVAETQGSVQSTAVSVAMEATTSVIEVTDTSAARTITLPRAVDAYPGRSYVVKDTWGAAGTNNITVKTAGLTPDVDHLTWQLSRKTTGDATVRLITAAALPACTAAGSGVGKTLTGNAVGLLVIDSVNTANNDIVLVKNQADPKDNGIYVVTEKGVAVTTAFILTRKTTFDQVAEVFPGYRAKATAGTVNSGLVYALVGGIDDEMTSVIDTDYGSLTVYSDGVNWHTAVAVVSTVDALSWEEKYRRLSDEFCGGPSNLSGSFHFNTLARGSFDYEHSAAGTIVAVNQSGGPVRMDTTEAANEYVSYRAQLSGNIAHGVNERWFVAARIKLLAIPTAANALVMAGAVSNSLATTVDGSDIFGVGVLGTNHDAGASNTKFGLFVNNGAGAGTFLPSLANYDLGTYHTLIGKVDGTTLYFQLDDEAEQSVVNVAQAPSAFARYFVGCRNKAVAENVSFEFSDILFGWRIL